MITINKAILHILDYAGGFPVYSQECMNLGEEATSEYLSKHIEKIMGDSGAKIGAFREESPFRRKLTDYVNGLVEFSSFTSEIAGEFYELMRSAGEDNAADFIVIDYIFDEIRYLAVLLFKNKIGFTHQVYQDEGKVRNEIIRHYALLPGTGQKPETYAAIRLSGFEIRFHDKKRELEAEEILILPEKLLQCSSGISGKETIKIVNKIASKIAEDHGENNALAVTRAKSFIFENATVAEDFEPVEISKEVFSSPALQREFCEEVKKAGMSAVVKVEQNYAMKASQKHKIKTDTGIEISYPVDYGENPDYIEFTNNPDGTISISLKNIGKIVNK